MCLCRKITTCPGEIQTLVDNGDIRMSINISNKDINDLFQMPVISAKGVLFVWTLISFDNSLSDLKCNNVGFMALKIELNVGLDCWSRHYGIFTLCSGKR